MITVHYDAHLFYMDVKSSRKLYQTKHEVKPQSSSPEDGTQQSYSYYTVCDLSLYDVLPGINEANDTEEQVIVHS